MMMLKALILAAIAVSAQTQGCNSETLAESGYTVVTEINGFSLACPPGQSGNTTFAATVTCTCEPSGESCSIFKDGEPSTEEAFVAAFSD